MLEMSEIIELFSADNDEFAYFDRVENKFSKRSDLHAFILLDKIAGNTERDIVSASEHDVIYLGVNMDELRNITREQIIDLVRCGVFYDSDYECLKMFT